MEDQDLETRLVYFRQLSEASKKSVQAEHQRVAQRQAAYRARWQEVYANLVPRKPFILKINFAPIFSVLLLVAIGLIILSGAGVFNEAGAGATLSGVAVAALVVTGAVWSYQARLKPYYLTKLRLAVQNTNLRLREETLKEMNYKNMFGIVQECKALLDQQQPIHTLSNLQQHTVSYDPLHISVIPVSEKLLRL